MRIRSIEISSAAEGVLRASTWEENVLKLPPGQLDRKLYEAVNKVLTALGGKWNRHKGGHVFSGAASTELQAALDAGGVVDVKKTLEQFFTPPALAARMAEIAGVRAGMQVLEPSAGNGSLVRAAVAAGGSVWAYEIDDALRAGLVRDFYSQFGAGGLAVDFMESTPNAVFDVVLMNPPFSRNQDIAHVEHAFGFLKPGGTLVAIMSPHFTFADDEPSRRFRALLGVPENFRLGVETGVELKPGFSMERLPDGTFKQSGTNVGTVLVTMRK